MTRLAVLAALVSVPTLAAGEPPQPVPAAKPGPGESDVRPDRRRSEGPRGTRSVGG
jgi:hypothetical protein